MDTILDNQSVTATLTETDAAGAVVPNQFDAPPTWGAVPAALVSLAPSADGSSCVITPTGAGSVQINVSASVGGNPLSASGTLQINPGAPTNLVLTFQPVAAPAAPSS